MERDPTIDEQIAALFARHEAYPTDGKISQAIASLWVQKGDYQSAIAWYEHAFHSGGRVDARLENIINDLKLRARSESK